MDCKIVQAVVVLLMIAVAGCKPHDDPQPQPSTNITGRQVYVVCEGSLGNGNGALSLYLPEKDSVYEDVYKSANGSGVGDVFESMTRIGDKYFLCINNSDKVLCIRTDNRQLVGTISIPKPRNILYVSPTKAYVSTLFSNKVYIINPQTLQVTGNITMPYQNPEGMLLADNGRAIVCTWDTAAHYISAIDTAADTVFAQHISSPIAPSEAVADKYGRMWVLNGNTAKGIPAVLSLYYSYGLLQRTFLFPSGTDPLRLCTNATKDTLYWIEADYNGGTTNNGIYRMDVSSSSLPTQAFVPAQSLQYFWAVGVEPSSGYIYVGNPLGFTQRGSVQVYKQDGTLVKTFKVGVGPGHFYFEQ